jgi:hypothetical protein
MAAVDEACWFDCSRLVRRRADVVLHVRVQSCNRWKVHRRLVALYRIDVLELLGRDLEK